MIDNIKWDDDIEWDAPTQPKSLFQKIVTPFVSEEFAKRPGPLGEGLRMAGRTLPSTTLISGPLLSSLVPPIMRERMAPREISEQTSPLAITSYAMPFLGKKAQTIMTGRKPALEKSAMNIWGRILKPTTSDIQIIEAKGGAKISDAIRLAAEEKLPVSIKEGTLDKLETGQAQEKVKKTINILDDFLTKKLSDPSKAKSYIDLKQIGAEAKRQARRLTDNDTVYMSITNDIDEYINNAMKYRGTKYFSASELNKIKKGMYEVGFNQMKPTADKAARYIARSIRGKIEKLFPDEDIQGINNVMGKYITLQRLLKKSNGRTIGPSQIGKTGAKALGAVIGSNIPIAGTIGGYYLGGKIMELLSSPVRLAIKAGKQISKAGATQKTLRTILKKP